MCRRKDWEEKAARTGQSFNIESVAGKLDEVILRHARNKHHSLFGAPQSTSQSSGWRNRTASSGEGGANEAGGVRVYFSCGSVPLLLHFFGVQAYGRGMVRKAAGDWKNSDSKKPRAEIQCYKCKQWGHYATECWGRHKK